VLPVSIHSVCGLRDLSREMTEAQRKEVTQLFLALSPRMQTVALGCMRELMTRERGSSNG
jgi:hypothetical protein